MTAAKRKAQTTSILEKIDGIGEARAKALLMKFGGLAAIKKATAEELTAVRGVTPEIAQNIVDYFQKERK